MYYFYVWSHFFDSWDVNEECLARPLPFLVEPRNRGDWGKSGLYRYRNVDNGDYFTRLYV